jgi:hypothetical protein
VASSVSVIVPLDWATFVLLPSIDAPQSLRPQAVAGSRAENSRPYSIIKRRSNFAMQYRACETP